MKKLAIGLTCFCFILESTAQDYQRNQFRSDFDKSAASTNHQPSRFKYYFNGSVGLYFPTHGPDKSDYNGSLFTFQFQANYKDNLFARLFVDSYSIGYKAELVTQGITLDFSDRVQLNDLGADFGYTWLIGRFSPYAYGGVGVAFVDLPRIVSTNGNIVRFDKPAIQTISYRGGAGFDFEIASNFIVYLEGQYLSIPDVSLVQQQPLNGLSLQFGFKTCF